MALKCLYESSLEARRTYEIYMLEATHNRSCQLPKHKPQYQTKLLSLSTFHVHLTENECCQNLTKDIPSSPKEFSYLYPYYNVRLKINPLLEVTYYTTIICGAPKVLTTICQPGQTIHRQTTFI